MVNMNANFQRLLITQLWLAVKSISEISLFPRQLKKIPTVRPKMGIIDTTTSSILSEDLSCIKYTDMDVSFALGNCYILVTDIVGSTRLYNEDPCKMKNDIDIHDNVARDLAKRFNGHIVANEGDSFHVVFEYLHNAINFAMNFPEQLVENMIEFPVRIGINRGEMCVRKLCGYKCYGETVDEVIRFIKHNQGEKICIKESLLAEYNFQFMRSFCKHK